MKFRPCIDIHNGKVKQIVGGSLKDEGNMAKTNFASDLNAAFYANMYKEDCLRGGHIILLNSRQSEYYEQTKQQAKEALRVYPKGLQIGGGITDENAYEYIECGASHVIVTSYVFRGGEFCRENLKKLVHAVGKEHIVLDLSCRKQGEDYYVVTDRWQKYTIFSQIVTCYASFHQLYLFTIFLYETVPPKRSRALPIVKSSCPPPKLRNRSKSSSELIPPAYVIGIFPHCPSICTSCSSIPDRFPSTSTPWIKNSSQ